MKKLFVVLFMVTGIVSVNAQNLSLGPIASFNHSWITGEAEGRQFNPGFKVGGTLTYSFQPHWAVGADLVYSSEGVRYKNTSGSFESKTQVNLNYIRVPLKAIYFFGDLGDRIRPKLYAGPSFGFLTGGKIKTEEKNLTTGVTDKDPNMESKDYFKGFDLGLMLGAGLNYRLSEAIWLNVDLNYTNGLLDVTKADGSWSANRNLGLNVGVTFPFGTVVPKK